MNVHNQVMDRLLCVKHTEMGKGSIPARSVASCTKRRCGRRSARASVLNIMLVLLRLQVMQSIQVYARSKKNNMNEFIDTLASKLNYNRWTEKRGRSSSFAIVRIRFCSGAAAGI